MRCQLTQKLFGMEFYVYLLECNDSTYYCGYTKDTLARVKSHNSGTASRYTRARRPVKLRYLEKKKTIKNAMKREREIKKLSRKQKEELIKKYS